MEPSERAAQQETDLQRWADDGGRIPGTPPQARAGVRPVSPWRAVGVAAAVGFAVGWLSTRRA